jgi:hypothetical protein
MCPIVYLPTRRASLESRAFPADGGRHVIRVEEGTWCRWRFITPRHTHTNVMQMEVHYHPTDRGGVKVPLLASSPQHSKRISGLAASRNPRGASLLVSGSLDGVVKVHVCVCMYVCMYVLHTYVWVPTPFFHQSSSTVATFPKHESLLVLGSLDGVVKVHETKWPSTGCLSSWSSLELPTPPAAVHELRGKGGGILALGPKP